LRFKANFSKINWTRECINSYRRILPTIAHNNQCTMKQMNHWRILQNSIRIHQSNNNQAKNSKHTIKEGHILARISLLKDLWHLKIDRKFWILKIIKEALTVKIFIWCKTAQIQVQDRATQIWKSKEFKPRKAISDKEKVDKQQMKALIMAWLCARFLKAALKSFQLYKVMLFMRVKCQMKSSNNMMKESARRWEILPNFR